MDVYERWNLPIYFWNIAGISNNGFEQRSNDGFELVVDTEFKHMIDSRFEHMNVQST